MEQVQEESQPNTPSNIESIDKMPSEEELNQLRENIIEQRDTQSEKYLQERYGRGLGKIGVIRKLRETLGEKEWGKATNIGLKIGIGTTAVIGTVLTGGIGALGIGGAFASALGLSTGIKGATEGTFYYFFGGKKLRADLIQTKIKEENELNSALANVISLAESTYADKDEQYNDLRERLLNWSNEQSYKELEELKKKQAKRELIESLAGSVVSLATLGGITEHLLSGGGILLEKSANFDKDQIAHGVVLTKHGLAYILGKAEEIAYNSGLLNDPAFSQLAGFHKGGNFSVLGMQYGGHLLHKLGENSGIITKLAGAVAGLIGIHGAEIVGKIKDEKIVKQNKFSGYQVGLGKIVPQPAIYNSPTPNLSAIVPANVANETVDGGSTIAIKAEGSPQAPIIPNSFETDSGKESEPSQSQNNNKEKNVSFEEKIDYLETIEKGTKEWFKFLQEGSTKEEIKKLLDTKEGAMEFIAFKRLKDEQKKLGNPEIDAEITNKEGPQIKYTKKYENTILNGIRETIKKDESLIDKISSIFPIKS